MYISKKPHSPQSFMANLRCFKLRKDNLQLLWSNLKHSSEKRKLMLKDRTETVYVFMRQEGVS